MEIKDATVDPLTNVIEFTRKKREPQIGMVRSDHKSCSHPKTQVNEEKRSVSCQDCGTLLDPFQVLWEMAIKERRWLHDLEAWEAMRDSRLADRYDAEWMRYAQDVTNPPSDPVQREVWDTFKAYLGDKFCAMYRRRARKRHGPTWYGRDARGSCVSLEYVRSQLVTRIDSRG